MAAATVRRLSRLRSRWAVVLVAGLLVGCGSEVQPEAHVSEGSNNNHATRGATSILGYAFAAWPPEVAGYRNLGELSCPEWEEGSTVYDTSDLSTEEAQDCSLLKLAESKALAGELVDPMVLRGTLTADGLDTLSSGANALAVPSEDDDVEVSILRVKAPAFEGRTHPPDAPGFDMLVVFTYDEPGGSGSEISLLYSGTEEASELEQRVADVGVRTDPERATDPIVVIPEGCYRLLDEDGSGFDLLVEEQHHPWRYVTQFMGSTDGTCSGQGPTLGVQFVEADDLEEAQEHCATVHPEGAPTGDPHPVTLEPAIDGVWRCFDAQWPLDPPRDS